MHIRVLHEVRIEPLRPLFCRAYRNRKMKCTSRQGNRARELVRGDQRGQLSVHCNHQIHNTDLVLIIHVHYLDKFSPSFRHKMTLMCRGALKQNSRLNMSCNSFLGILICQRKFYNLWFSLKQCVKDRSHIWCFKNIICLYGEEKNINQKDIMVLMFNHV